MQGDEKNPIDLTFSDAGFETESLQMDLDSEQSYTSGDEKSDESDEYFLSRVQSNWYRLHNHWQRNGLPGNVPFARLYGILFEDEALSGEENTDERPTALGDFERIGTPEQRVLFQRRRSAAGTRAPEGPERRRRRTGSRFPVRRALNYDERDSG